MTKDQAQMIEWLRRRILESDGLDSPDYEYKEWSVEEGAGSAVYVYSVVGWVGDEETAAWALRTARHIAIGPRGGLTLLNTARYDGRRKRAAAHATGPRAVYALTL